MKIGVPTEVKNHEYRVALTPAGAHELSTRGHAVFVQAGAGLGSAIPDEDYLAVGAKILNHADDVWAEGDLLLKVKEPIASEYHRMRDRHVLFTYLHLAASRECTDALLERNVTAIAYETVQTVDGRLPLLAPMSEVAGRLAPQAGAYHLMRSGGGRGILPGGVPGTHPAKVVVIGAGVSGLNAAAVAVGLGADVTLLDLDVDRLRAVDQLYRGRVRTITSNRFEVEKAVLDADLVIGAVLVPGAKAPTLVSNDVVSRMKPGAVLVDISIDQGGCFEDSRPTTHAEPTYSVHGSVFYCVANMPGAVPQTSTHALTNATLPHTVAIAGKGWQKALWENPDLGRGLNTHAGHVTNAAVASAHGLTHLELDQVLRATAS
ncbi:alanine dehydrogenase [Streptomyces sp. CA-106131]|uniref:alanine dehydrogenase n=1 Tax=Streptomyces sp. CA-106131 TaxID=3240045 RepID=UPI003D9368BE